jgi:hypothetical protein
MPSELSAKISISEIGTSTTAPVTSQLPDLPALAGWITLNAAAR